TVRDTHPRLTIIDPISAFLDPRVNFNSDPAIRRALSPLAALAAHEQCAILLVRHLNKQLGGRALYRGLGSIGLIAACRIAWLAAPDPTNAGQYVLATSKNNLTSLPGSLSYEVASDHGSLTSPDIRLDPRATRSEPPRGDESHPQGGGLAAHSSPC